MLLLDHEAEAPELRFARWLRQSRLARGLSLRRLSAEVGLHFAYLSQLERGVTTPSEAVVRQLADYFQHPAPDELVLAAGRVPERVRLALTGLAHLTRDQVLAQWRLAARLAAAGGNHLLACSPPQLPLPGSAPLSSASPEWLIVPAARLETSNLGAALGTRPEAALDGDLDTFYWTERPPRTGDYLLIDLGEQYPVCGIHLFMGSFTGEYVRPADYLYTGVIQLSADQQDWQTVGRLNGLPELSLSFPARPARYLRILVTADQVYWAQIREIRLLCPPGASPHQPAWLFLRRAEQAVTRAEACLARAAATDQSEIQPARAELDLAKALLEKARESYRRAPAGEQGVKSTAARAARLADRAAALTVESREQETRAIWIDRPALLGGPSELRRQLDRFHDLGINLAFAEVFSRGAAAYPSRIAPADESMRQVWNDEDPLAFLLQEGGRRGIVVVPWLWVLCAGYDFDEGPLLRRHPDWADRSISGDTIAPTPQGTAWLNPALPAVRRFFAELAEELLASYPLAGLHLDYLRYHEESLAPFGYAPASLAAFARAQARGNRENREKQKDGVGALDFNRWRARNVTALLRTIARVVHRHGKELSATVWPDPQFALGEMHQAWPEWVGGKGRRPLVDCLVTTNYTPSLEVFRQRVLAGEGEFVARTASGPVRTGLLHGIGSWLLTPAELVDQITVARQSRVATGICLYSASTLAEKAQIVLAEGPFRRRAKPLDPGKPLRNTLRSKVTHSGNQTDVRSKTSEEE
ncbi:MAG: family 10 glycosylhydrolase [Limnochordales bacterium]|nr:family 10 glycosylhydrolase [Limnochordales bacterium]